MAYTDRLTKITLLCLALSMGTAASAELIDTSATLVSKDVVSKDAASKDPASTVPTADATQSAAAPDAFAAPKTLLADKLPERKKQFLPVDQAFVLKADVQSQQAVIHVKVSPGYYVYEKRFVVHSDKVQAGRIRFDQSPITEDDPEFGKVTVFPQDVNLTIPVQGTGDVTLDWQGCAKAGLCYPPQQLTFKVKAATATPVQTAIVAPTETAASEPALTISSGQVLIHPLGNKPTIQSTPLPDASVAQTASAAVVQAVTKPAAVNIVKNSIVSDPFGLADHPFLAIGLLFLAGLGLAFTPCVLPMLPIVANLVATQHRRSASHGFGLAAAYAIGVAVMYAVLGALIAIFGHQFNLIAWSQQPVVLIVFAVIFAVLGLHSFEVFEFHLPHFLRAKIEKAGRFGQQARWSGSVLGCLIAGFFSALIVSPCISAPLAGVLLSVSTVGNPILGAVALFSLGIGLGVPLMILGATEGRFLPKAGTWLNWVRRGFGLLLFVVAFILLNRVFDTWWMLLAWAVLVFFFAMWFWVWTGKRMFITRILAILTGIWAILLAVGAFTGGTDPLHPWANWGKTRLQSQIQVIHTLAELEQVKQQHPRLLVDVSADWCIACHINERALFQTNPVAELNSWTRVKLDVTQSNEDSKAVLQALNLFGPPALLLYQNGQLVDEVTGEPKPAEFQAVLKKHP